MLRKLLLISLGLLCLCGCGTPKNPPEITPVATPTGATATITEPCTPTPTATSTPTPSPSPTVTPTNTPTPTPTLSPTPTPVVTTITCSFAGDVTLGSDLINQNSSLNFYTVYDRVQDDSFFFANVLPVFSEDDLTLVNLEGVLSDRGTRKDKTFAFRGKSSYVNILTQGSVEAVSLANNHSFDYGNISHQDTRDILSEAGICYSYEDVVSYFTVKDVKIALIAIYAMRDGLHASKALLDQTIAEAKSNDADLIITSFHWGIEKSTDITPEQQKLAYYAIDSGANLVLGHHPHILQPVELYNGCYIVYSLANFCFGGHTNPRDRDTIIVQQSFTFIDSVYQPELNRFCVIPCSVSSAPDRNNYQPTPQTGEEADRIIDRLNGYCTDYNISFEKESESRYIPTFPKDPE